jgi:superfamily II DNA or RNA helicase
MAEIKATQVNSKAEDLFVQLFCEAFGPDNSENLYVQYPFVDIYGNRRYIDFALESQGIKIAIEIDGETYHNPKKVSSNKYYDDLLKQNSLVFNEWKVFRWAYNQLDKQPEKVKDELVTYLGQTPFFKEFQDHLPNQQGKVFELRDYQSKALENLRKMREDGETIALLYHATGVGKTLTAATDAKVVGGRTLFLVNALKLSVQAEKTFATIWPEATRGQYTGGSKDTNQDIIFATIQSLSRGLSDFTSNAFDYIVIDECHHAVAKTYQKIFSYFRPKFILGLSATPERTDGEDLLELFQNVAHKMDLKTAVEKGILASIRCIRVKTNVDLSDVRINGIKYNPQDLESKLFIPERNELIVNTLLEYVPNKKTVIFCASISHAKEVAALLKSKGVIAEAISGRDALSAREQLLDDYEHGNTSVLCACDLLNEGWDSPHTQVLFMARPTMSRTIYIQQLGRGTRKSTNKDELLVFDFVDNTNMFNQAYSLHRLLNISEYHPLDYVLAPESKKRMEHDLLFRGEKPSVIWDIPIMAEGFEMINLFNWQDEVKGMISQNELLRMVNIQKTTLNRFFSEGKINADIQIPISNKKSFKYFKPETVSKYARMFGWTIINDKNIKSVFMDYISNMNMVLAYKPVLIKAMFANCTDEGKILVRKIVGFFISYYQSRKESGLYVESGRSIFSRETYSSNDVEKLIFRYPFDVMNQMNFVHREKNIEWVSINKSIYANLSEADKLYIIATCDEKLEEYYSREKNQEQKDEN